MSTEQLIVCMSVCLDINALAVIVAWTSNRLTPFWMKRQQIHDLNHGRRRVQVSSHTFLLDRVDTLRHDVLAVGAIWTKEWIKEVTVSSRCMHDYDRGRLVARCAPLLVLIFASLNPFATSRSLRSTP
jgi:hypothetical protein